MAHFDIVSPLAAEVSLDFGSPDLRDLGRVAVTAASYYVDFTPTFRVSQLNVL